MLRKLSLLMFKAICLMMLTPLAAVSAEDGWVNVKGHVIYKEQPVCAMVLANGQHVFSCSGDGSFSVDVPLDANGTITVQAFCSGRAPYRHVIDPTQAAAGWVVTMEDIQGTAALDVAATLRVVSDKRCTLTGSVKSGEQPLCAIVLANGVHQFTCSGDGRFNLNLPIDANGEVTFYAFCSGRQPYKFVYGTEDITPGIPFSNIAIDGDMSDWDDVPAAIDDLTDDVYADGIDLLRAYVARDREAIYFMIETDTDLATIPEPDYGCQFMFHGTSSDIGRDCYFNNYRNGWSVIVFNTDDGFTGQGTPLMQYPEHYGSLSGTRIEYKVLLEDYDAGLSNMNLQVRLHDRAQDSDDWTHVVDLSSIAGDAH
jgi:hypothetical protein